MLITFEYNINLQLAVEHSWGGQHTKEKAQWMVAELEKFFNNNGEFCVLIFLF